MFRRTAQLGGACSSRSLSVTPRHPILDRSTETSAAALPAVQRPITRAHNAGTAPSARPRWPIPRSHPRHEQPPRLPRRSTPHLPTRRTSHATPHPETDPENHLRGSRTNVSHYAHPSASPSPSPAEAEAPPPSSPGPPSPLHAAAAPRSPDRPPPSH